MKRIFLLALTAALAVSLWFNWRNRSSIADVVAAPPNPVDAADPLMPMKLEEIDFSGTGLADEAWQLKTPGALEEKIPSTFPASEPGSETPPRPAPDDWNPDVKLKLEPRPP